MNWNDITTETYDKSAKQLAEYFAGIGPRIDDIERAINLTSSNDPIVVEIGCGDGRDAKEIVSRVDHYIGVDPSEGLLSIARSALPGTTFVKADALSFHCPKETDVVIAFASLLHVNRKDLVEVLSKIYSSLKINGILYVSSKESDSYKEAEKNDQFGKRMFYYYNSTIFKDLAGNGFESVYESRQTIGNTNWFTLALRKVA